MFSLVIQQQNFLLLPQKAMFWEQKKMLILSDVHFGKTGHFRKAGIAIPQKVFEHDIFRLLDLIQQFKPIELVIVGDLFHSHQNKEHNAVAKFRKDVKHVKFTLVKGNHDILDKQWYKDQDITVAEDFYTIDNVVFVHEPLAQQENHTALFTISGHVHPSVKLAGKGKQAISLPCFYVTAQEIILPAFGNFTGSFAVQKNKKNRILAIANNSIIEF
jgi:uncharacterized protein